MPKPNLQTYLAPKNITGGKSLISLSLFVCVSIVAAMNGGNSKKRTAPQQQPSPAQQKHHAAMEEEEFDEDVYYSQDGLIDEDTQILRDIEERSAKKLRLSKWARPQLSESYKSQSQSIGNYFPLLSDSRV